MEDVLVLHSADASDVAKYILDYLANEKYNLRTSSLLDSSINLDHTRRALKVKVLILILSRGHLDFLRNCPLRSSYEKQIWNAKTTLVFLWGVGEHEDGDEEETSRETRMCLRDRIPGYRKFLKFSFEQHQELLRTTVIKLDGSDVPGTVEGHSVVQEVRRTERKGVAERKSSKRIQLKQFRIIPKTARCEEPTPLVLCFIEGTQSNFPTEEATEGEVEETEKEENGDKKTWKGKADGEGRAVVTVAFGSNDPEEQLIVNAECINENTYLFYAPEHSVGDVPIHIIMNGDVIGQSSVVYKSLKADLVLSIGQIYMFLLNRLLGFLQDRDLLIPEVDRRCCGLLDDKAAGNSIPIQAFEQIFGLAATCEGQSEYELPTLLHLAAKFGLVNFESRLKDLPDADPASEIRNRLGQATNDLKRSRGHTLSTRRDSTPTVTAEREGVYESVFPPENPNFCTKKDLLISPGEPKEEEGAYMEISSVLKKIENGPKSIVHPAFPECPLNSDVVPPPSLVNVGQQELVNIQQQVKSNQLTIYEAEVLFKEWQLRHSSSDWENSKAARLTHLTQKHKTLKTKMSVVEFLKHSKLTKQKPVKTTQVMSPSSSSIPEEPFPPPPSHLMLLETSSSSSPRNSIASSSSRESCMSKGSTSGFETVDEEEDYNGTVVSSKFYLTATTSFSTRESSANMEKLEEDLKRPNAPRPPPPPPRRTPFTPSVADRGNYIEMNNPNNRQTPGDGQGRRGPPVAPRERKVSCPAVTPSAQSSRSSWNTTDQNDSPAYTGVKHSPGDGNRPTSTTEESVRPKKILDRKISLPTEFSENSA